MEDGYLNKDVYLLVAMNVTVPKNATDFEIHSFAVREINLLDKCKFLLIF